MDNFLRVAIISDMHCRPTCSPTTTYLHTDIMRQPALKHPIQALIDLRLEADIILCPGDITDQIDPQGLVTGWSYLEEIKESFKAPILAATIGNHDVDSRQKWSSNPFDFIKRLKANYPVGEAMAKNFWNDNFCVLDQENVQLLIFNSSYSHNSSNAAKVSDIEDHILENMKKELKKLETKKIRIAMCHHHPIQHSNLSYRDEDSLNKGDKFLELLEEFDFHLVVHGHKHEPKIRYINSLTVFGAGSFSSLQNVRDIAGNNFFHLLDIHPIQKKGKITSWVYSPTQGWRQQLDTQFPCFTGFGYQTNLSDLAITIRNWLLAKGQDVINYSNLIIDFPDLQYLIPIDQEKLNSILLKTHQIEFIPSLINNPKVIAKQIS
jgi:predicted phosphodiesterase